MKVPELAFRVSTHDLCDPKFLYCKSSLPHTFSMLLAATEERHDATSTNDLRFQLLALKLCYSSNS